MRGLSGNFVAAVVIEQRVLRRADLRGLLENPVRDLLVAGRPVTDAAAAIFVPWTAHDADFCFPV